MEHERRELETLPQTYVHKAFHVGPDFRQVGLWGQWLNFFPVSLFKKKKLSNSKRKGFILAHSSRIQFTMLNLMAGA